MMKTIRGKLVVAITTLGLATTMLAVSAGASATLNGDLTYTAADGAASLAPAIGGSTFDFPFFSSAIQAYESAAANASGANAPTQIPGYGAVGSTAGKKGVIAGTYVVGASDVPMGTVTNGVNLDSSLLTGADAAHTLGSYVQIPVVLGGEAMMYNLPMLNAKYKKTPVKLTSALIADVFDGKVTKWNDPKICKLNPLIAVVKKNKKGRVVSRRCALPNLAITPVFRSDGSGTSYIFSDYLHTTQGAKYETPSGTEVYANTTFNQGQLPSNAVGGYGNPGVASDVVSKVGALGYVEYAYVLIARASGANVTSALVLNSKGKAVAISPTSVAADAAAFSSTPPTESNGQVSSFSIVNGNTAGSYPIAGYSWAITRQDWSGIGTLNGETMAAKFLDWCTQAKGGQVVAKNNGYVPLPSYVTALASKIVASMTYNKVSLGLK